MSGYLEVKYPFKSNLGLNPFKTWKKQWCILRPSATHTEGGSLAVYCSEAGAAAGCIELAAGCVVCRTKSRSRPHAFAVFSPEDSRKPRILLAAYTLHDCQLWIEKIKALLKGSKLLGDSLLKDSYPISVVSTEWSRQCGLTYTDGTLTVGPAGVTVRQQTQHEGTLLKWKCIENVAVDNRTCIITVNSDPTGIPGELRLTTPLSAALVSTVRETLRANTLTMARQLSKSDGDLPTTAAADNDIGDVSRSSWYSEPSEVSLDDTDLVMCKGSRSIPRRKLSRCTAAGHLAPSDVPPPCTAFDDSMSDRRSLASIASGIYEEILDVPRRAHPAAPQRSQVPPASSQVPPAAPQGPPAGPRDEPTYESVSECVYATMRRKRYPPPLPPRLPFGTLKLGESWSSRMNKPGEGPSASSEPCVTRHSSLGSLPRCCSVSSASSATSTGSDFTTKTLPKTKQTFNVFRKRLKSDSVTGKLLKENKDTCTKKKKFDFTPTKDIFKNFKVGKKMKGLKIASGNLKKIGETKSCEFLDEKEHLHSGRCSKSVECLEQSSESFDDDGESDLSIECNNDAMASLSLPQDIVDLIVRRRERLTDVRLHAQIGEDDYMPMSPIVVPPKPIEHHYIVMSPRANIA